MLEKSSDYNSDSENDEPLLNTKKKVRRISKPIRIT